MGSAFSRFADVRSPTGSCGRQKSRRHDEEAVANQAASPTPTPGPRRRSRTIPRRSNVTGLPFSLLDEHRGDLIYTIEYGSEEHVNVINLAELQRLNLQHLRRTLTKTAIDISKDKTLNDGNADELARCMHTYCDALRDWDYMEEKWDPSITKDPFKLMSLRLRHSCIMDEYDLQAAIPRRWNRKFRGSRLAAPNDGNTPELPGTSRASLQRSKNAEALAKRTWAGLLGGLALIGPMLLMVLHKDLLTTLLTVAVSTFLFAMLIARFTEISPNELMGSTAAYAAVLVVFVGTST